MVQQNTNLPEGTDSIINGAMETDTGSTTGNRTPGTSATTSTGTTTTATSSTTATGGTATGLMDKVRSQGSKLSGEAAGKARGFVGQGLERGSEALSNVSRLVGDTADGLDERLGPEYGDYARRAAQALDSTASKLATKDPDELIDDTRQFVRKSPGIALAGAAIVGFALARLIKSGLDSDDDRSNGSRS
ncbi:hypothetical protein H8M03_04380 [Sphingomonas sabuli]|uniref:CsbD family protein n=1 Tax=Sphingomonas sabuli TaxID=2764186 RepID=A0A7G9L4M1_9SPHN|nr:hypothetical protein [Sphingomonas sabuli]QNM83570.1 hypothetical protein H8M03_04380 [Sphingomonas sabuli]